MNHFTFRTSVMLWALLVTAAAPAMAQHRRPSDVRLPILSASDPTDPYPVPPPPDPGDPVPTGFALHF